MTWLKPFAFGLALLAGAPAWGDALIVFAAASLKEPLDAIVAGEDGVRVSYGGSGTLARQVQQGAPADVILLANDAWMAALVESGDVTEPVDFAGNRLVMIGQPGAGEVSLTAPAILAALKGGRLAVGFTASVPAGIYAKEALVALGLWETLAPHLAEVDNVRAALALVARGEAPMGIVYTTDTRVVPDLSVVAVFPQESHGDIAYWAAQVTTSTHPAAADFVARMQSEPVRLILAEAGFCAPAGPCEAQ